MQYLDRLEIFFDQIQKNKIRVNKKNIFFKIFIIEFFLFFFLKAVTSNFIIDHPDLLATSTPTPKKRSFFRRFKSKQKQEITLSTNSLTSDDCTR
jgi:hypothetical protein